MASYARAASVTALVRNRQSALAWCHLAERVTACLEMTAWSGNDWQILEHSSAELAVLVDAADGQKLWPRCGDDLGIRGVTVSDPEQVVLEAEPCRRLSST